MKAVRVVVLALLLSANMAFASSEINLDSPNGMHFGHKVAEHDEIEPLDEQPTQDSKIMQESGVPESDIHGEGSEAMVKFQEDALDTGGEGAQMQQSVPSQTVLATEKQEVEEEEDIRVSDDMVPGAAALSTVFQSKSDEINDIRQQLEASKTSVQQQAREAKRLIKEAYGKQAYLRDLQKQLLDQSVSIARQEEQIKLKGMELDKMRAELEDKLKESNQQAAAARAQASMSAAIQTQISELERKSHEVSSTKDVEKSDLVKLKDTLAQMKNEIDAKDKDLSKKETDMKQLFVELSALKKSSERHELFLKQQEQLIKQQQAEIKQKNDELKAREERLNLKTTLESHHHVADLEAKVAPQIALQTAVSVQAAVEKPLSELPLEGSEVIGHVDDLSIADQIAQQPRIEIPKRAPKVVSIPETEVLNVTIVDRSTRSVETKLDSRPPTYGQKLLVGQAYSASFNPTANGERDPDDLCRNSRGEVVDCGLYEAVSKGAVAVPPIVPRAASIGSDSGSVWSDNEYQIESNGPCVLKCAYHKGPTSAAGPRNIEEISIEIPTTVSNNTYACPKTNNGFPFLSCSLLLDGSDKCRSTCVFDGDANPLKPKMLGIGQPFSGPQATKFDLSEFRSLAHTTYTLTTDRGCKSSMKADPLVACEVHL